MKTRVASPVGSTRDARDQPERQTRSQTDGRWSVSEPCAPMQGRTFESSIRSKHLRAGVARSSQSTIWLKVAKNWVCTGGGEATPRPRACAKNKSQAPADDTTHSENYMEPWRQPQEMGGQKRRNRDGQSDKRGRRNGRGSRGTEREERTETDKEQRERQADPPPEPARDWRASRQAPHARTHTQTCTLTRTHHARPGDA